MLTLNNIGWMGSLLLGFCGLPQAISCYRNKSASGISFGFLVMWMLGEILTLIYVAGTTQITQLPLLFNYLVNILCISVILYYARKDLDDEDNK